MTKDEFIAMVSAGQPESLAKTFLMKDAVTAFPSAGDYANFKQKVHDQIEGADSVSIVGTGNWRFSLNPDKDFKEFDSTSDIDIAVISLKQFNETWEELRRVHRLSWYAFPYSVRERIRRNAEDVYSGFVTPAWIPGPRSNYRHRFKLILNKLSDKSVQFKPVKMLYFKNEVEAIDYYKRGFLLAQRKVEPK